jgi:hypothetical protein
MSKFGDAFKAARAAGKKTFTWNGNSYNTKTKQEGVGTKDKDEGAGSAAPATKTTASAGKGYYDPGGEYDQTFGKELANRKAMSASPPKGNMVSDTNMKKGGKVAMKKSLPAFMKADKAQDAKMMKKPMKKMASGGSINGIASKGKTNTKYPKMKGDTIGGGGKA